MKFIRVLPLATLAAVSCDSKPRMAPEPPADTTVIAEPAETTATPKPQPDEPEEEKPEGMPEEKPLPPQSNTPAADLRAVYPVLTEIPALPAALSPGQQQIVDRFTASQKARVAKPNGKGVSEDKLRAQLANLRAFYRLDSDGRPIRLGDERASRTTDAQKPAGFVQDVVPDLIALAGTYAQATAAQAAEIETTYRDLIRLWNKQGCRFGASPGWIGNGYNWRGTGWRSMDMVHVLPPAEADDFLDTIVFASGAGTLLSKHPHTSTDICLNYYGTMFAALGRVNDPRRKWQRLAAIRNYLDLAFLQTPLVSADGGIIHHGGHHIGYGGYSFASVVGTFRGMEAWGLRGPHEAEVIDRMTRAADAWAWTSLNGQIPPVFDLRPGPVWKAGKKPGVSSNNGVRFSIAVADLKRIAEDAPDISGFTDLARIAGSGSGGAAGPLPAAWKPLANAALLAPPHGHRPFPVMGAAIHRRDDWMVVVRGANKYWRGGESYAPPSSPGSYMGNQIQGALFVFSQGSPGHPVNVADSGYTNEGWDHGLYPNVTAPRPGSEIALTTPKKPGYFGAGAKQGGGVNLGENGMWSWNPGYCRKSAFFFGKRVTLVTRSIQSGGKDIRTAVLQSPGENARTSPLMLDGRAATNEGTATLDCKTTAHTLLDTRGTGYHIPAGNPPLHMRRGIQKWTYALPHQLKPGVDPKSANPGLTRNSLAAVLPHYNPTEGFFTTAWFAHGDAAKQGDSCTFDLLVRTTPDELAAFARACASPATAPHTLETTADVHHFTDKETATHCIATFADNTGAAPFTINRPVTLMWRPEGEKISVSLGSTIQEDRRPFVVTFAFPADAEGLPEGAKAVKSAAATTIEIPYRDQTPVRFTLRK